MNRRNWAEHCAAPMRQSVPPAEGWTIPWRNWRPIPISWCCRVLRPLATCRTICSRWSSDSPITWQVRHPVVPVNGCGRYAPARSFLPPARWSDRWCFPTMTGPASCWRARREPTSIATAYYQAPVLRCSRRTTKPIARCLTCTPQGYALFVSPICVRGSAVRSSMPRVKPAFQSPPAPRLWARAVVSA